MEDKKKFNARMSAIMGNDWVAVKETGMSNKVLGALANNTDFNDFKAHFDAMAKNLYGIYKSDANELRKLVKTFRELADAKNWQGAYAELCALHLLNMDGYGAIDTDVTLPAAASWASKLGHSSDTNMDGHIGCADVYFDTKALRDSVTPILRNVVNTAFGELKRDGSWTEAKDPWVMFEFELTDSEEDYQNEFRKLVEELKMKYGAKVECVQSEVIVGLVYRFQRKAVCTTVGCYSPYRRAKELAKAVMVRYSDKFLLDRKFVLVLVNHPWFNQVDRGSLISNGVMYRALARRLFMQYGNKRAPMYMLNRKFTGSETIDAVSRKISAVIMIDVHSAKNEGRPYSWYMYVNPRADNKLMGARWWFEELGVLKHGWCMEWDGFEDDNY